MHLDYDIALATPEDIPGMLALQEANLPDKGGSLSVRLTEEWFRDAILEKSIVVARCNSRIVGYVMGTALAGVPGAGRRLQRMHASAGNAASRAEVIHRRGGLHGRNVTTAVGVRLPTTSRSVRHRPLQHRS